MILRVDTTNALTGDHLDTLYRIFCNADCGESVEAESIDEVKRQARAALIAVDERTGRAICHLCRRREEADAATVVEHGRAG